MKLLDERGIGTVWSICKEKFALAGHTHNYAGSGSPGGSANSAIGVVDYNQTGKTIQIGYSGAGITGDQIKYIAGYTDGSGNVNAKIKDVSKDALKSWLGLGSLAYSSSSIPTNLSLLNNDKGFVTGSVSGNTITINGASTTWSNTWRGIQDNLASYSTSDSLSANQGRILKGLIDGKANSSHTHSWSLISFVPAATTTLSGIMSFADKAKLDGIAYGANNYTLPTATNTTLGGIKVDFIPRYDNCNFKVLIDVNGNANTFIPGLKYGDDECLGGVQVNGGSNGSVTYTGNGVTFNNQHGLKIGDVRFRGINGYFALTSDLSDLCRFNFVNSISECKSDRINFLFRCSDAIIDLSPFDSYPDGTILLITANSNLSRINHQSGIWFYDGDEADANYKEYIYKSSLVLITKYVGKVHCYIL